MASHHERAMNRPADRPAINFCPACGCDKLDCFYHDTFCNSISCLLRSEQINQ